MSLEKKEPTYFDYDRYKKEYVKFSGIVYAELERFASEFPEKTHWYQNYFSTYLLWDAYLSFSDECELLPNDIRKGDLRHINCQQFREIMRCTYIYEKLATTGAEDAECGLRPNEDYKEINARLIAHPLWKKMAAQSRKTLQLLKLENQNLDIRTE